MGGLHPPIPAYPSMPVGSWPSPTPSGSLSFPLQVMGAKRSTSSLQSSTGWWAPKGSSARVCPPPLAGPGMKALLRLLSPDAPAPRGPRWVPVRRVSASWPQAARARPRPCWLLRGAQGGAAQEPALRGLWVLGRGLPPGPDACPVASHLAGPCCPERSHPPRTSSALGHSLRLPGRAFGRAEKPKPKLTPKDLGM